MGAKLSRGAGRGNVTIDNSVAVTGTVTSTISGTPTVTMGAVSITGTPTVTFGTVSMPSITVVSMPVVTASITSTQLTADGKIRISANDYKCDIAEGNISGHKRWEKIGYNDAIGTSQETMWVTSSEYVFPTIAGQLRISSTSTQDTLTTGTGAWTARIGYLKSDYSEGNVTLNLNGTNNVDSGASHADVWRVQSFRILSAGTNFSPVGTLTLTHLGNSITVGQMRPGRTRARTAVYTVPLGKTLYVNNLGFSCVGTKYLIFTFHAGYSEAGDVILPRGMFMPQFEVALLNTPYSKILEVPIKLPATTDLKVSVIAEAAGSLATCSLRGWTE